MKAVLLVLIINAVPTVIEVPSMKMCESLGKDFIRQKDYKIMHYRRYPNNTKRLITRSAGTKSASYICLDGAQ